jgi:hypothetical protein
VSRGGAGPRVSKFSDADARRSTVNSGTNLAGLLQHLTFVESKWFEENVAGGKATGKRSMEVDSAVSLQTLRSEYRAACETSNDISAGLWRHSGRPGMMRCCFHQVPLFADQLSEGAEVCPETSRR